MNGNYFENFFCKILFVDFYKKQVSFAHSHQYKFLVFVPTSLNCLQLSVLKQVLNLFWGRVFEFLELEQ